MNPFKLIAILLSFTLAGCGGSTNDDTSQIIPPPDGSTSDISLYAGDVSRSINRATPTVINLANSVASSDDSPVLLSKVESLSDNEQCQNIELGSLNFTLNADIIGPCIYSYEITDQQRTTTTTALTQVAVVSESALLIDNNRLIPISVTAQLGEQITITLTPPNTAGATLSTDVTLLGGGRVDNIDPETNKITYTAGSNDIDVGTTRIIYSYTDDDENVTIGEVDISVSGDTYNVSPIALPFLYLTEDDKAQEKTYTEVTLGDSVTIDLAASNLVSDADPEDSLQLVNLLSFNGKVVPLNDNLDNLSFIFTPSTTGRFHVTYTVSDHKGGYASNVIEFRVVGPWPNALIFNTGDIFAAPLSAEAAIIADYDIAGIAVEEALPNGNGFSDVPTYTWAVANSICQARGGSLPTPAQLDDFIAQEGNPFLQGDGDLNESVKNWPVARSYFTSEFDSSNSDLVKVYDLKTGTFRYEPSGLNQVSAPYLGYLTCIDYTPQELLIDNELLVVGLAKNLNPTFVTATGVEFDYTKPLRWSFTAPDDGSEAIPDINNNVQLDSHTGEILTLAAGFVKVIAEDYTGDLSTSVILESIKNLLAQLGGDPTFDSSTLSGSCIPDNSENNIENDPILKLNFKTWNPYQNGTGVISPTSGCDFTPDYDSFAQPDNDLTGHQIIMTGDLQTNKYDVNRSTAESGISTHGPINLPANSDFELTFWASAFPGYSNLQTIDMANDSISLRYTDNPDLSILTWLFIDKVFLSECEIINTAQHQAPAPPYYYEWKKFKCSINNRDDISGEHSVAVLWNHYVYNAPDGKFFGLFDGFTLIPTERN